MAVKSSSLTTKVNIQASKRAHGPCDIHNKRRVAMSASATVVIAATGAASAPTIGGFSGSSRIGVNTSSAKKKSSATAAKAKKSARRASRSGGSKGAGILSTKKSGGKGSGRKRRRDVDRDEKKKKGGKPKRKGGKGSSTGKKGTGGGRFKKRSKAKAKRGRKDPPSKKRKNRSKGTGGKQAKSKRRTMGGSKKASRSRPQRAGKNRVSTRPKTSQTAFMMASGYSVPTKAKRAKAAQGATRRKVKRRDIQTCKFENRNTAINNAQGTKRINSRAKLAYAKRRRLRSNTNVLKVAMPSNLSLGITAARFLRPISSVSILTTRKPEPKPDPPPDIPASSTNDELVLQSPDSLSNVLREMSIATYRPEILGMLDFLPTVDNTGQPTDVHTLMKLRETVHELKVENVEDTLEALEDGDIEGSYTSLKDSYIASTQETSQLLDTLSSVIRSTGLAKLSLDIKDNDSVLSAIAHQALTSQEVGTDGIDQSDLSFKNIMINELDFSSEGYASFCNTKVLGQLFTDLRRAIVRHSYSLMSNDNPARGDDENSVKYNFDYLAPHHRFKFRIWKVGKNFDATNYDDYLEFLGSLPTSTSDKVRLLIVSISRELVVSSGMGFLAKKTLGERFNVMESPLRSSIGHVGKNVLSPTKPAGSLSDYLVIDDTTGNQILPFETRSFRDTKNRVFLPGGSVFIDTALEGEGSKMFNVDSFDVFAKEFNKVTDDVEELIADLLNLEDENKELHASNIYKDMLQGFLDSVEGTKNARQLNQEQAAVIALLKLCNTNPQLKHLVFKFVLEIRDILVSVTKQESEQLAKKSALVAEKETIAAQKINLQMMADQYLTAGGSHPSSPAYVAYHSLLSQIRGLDSQTAQIDAQISSPDINIASASPSTTSLTSGTSFSTMTNMIMRTPSTTVSSLRSKIGKGTSSKQLMLKASPNPLTTTAQSIISIVAETMQEVSISSLKGYSSYRYNLQSLYSTLRSMSSTTRRSKNLLLCMAETAMTLQKSAGALATRDGGEERYTSNGLTNWHSWSGDSLLLLIFESYCSLASDYCSSSIVRLSRDRVQLVIDTSVNEGLDEALGDILELSKEDSTSFKDEMAQDRSSGVKSQTTKSNELLAQKGALSLGAAIRSYDDSKDTDALFADLSSNLEAFENDLDFIRKSLAVIQAIGTNLETSAAQMKSFFDMNDSSSDIKKTLISLSTTPKGRRILSTITPQQLALYRYLSNQLSAPSSTSSYLPERFMKSEQASNAVDVVLRDAAFGGVQANNIRVLAAGIPNGMISALMNPPYVMGSKESSETGAQENLVKINVYKRDLEFGDIIFKPRSFIFDTSLFIMSNAFSDINTTRDNFSTVAATKTRYTQVLPDGIQNSVTGQDLIEEERYGSIGGTTAATMLSNHLVDWAMKEYYRTNFGVDIHEANFTGDETTNELLIDPDGLSALMLAETDESTLTWITTGDVPIADLTGHVSLENSNYVQVADINDAKQFLVPSVSNVISSGEELEEELELPELSAEQLDNFRMLCKSTLFGPGVMKRNIMSPRMFDRVFMLPIDPDDFAIDIEATLETELGKEKYTSKTLKTITTVVQNAEGIDEVRLLPKNMGENYSAFNEFFVTVETVSTGE